MRVVLIGEVRTAQHVLRGLMRAGQAPVAMLTTDIDVVRGRSKMSPEYYCDLVTAGREHGIPVRVIQDLGAEADFLRAMAPDYMFVVGWPYIVREPILSIAPCIGMHPTRLPYRRGGAPLNWTILDGETAGAVSLIRLRAGLDDGEVLARKKFAIGADDYIHDILERVYQTTEDLVARSATALATGSVRWRPQDNSAATYTKRRTPEDGRIHWKDSAARIRNLIRATSRPFPGAFSMFEGHRLRVWRAEIPRGFRAPLASAPGAVLEVNETGVFVATADNALVLTEIQLDDTPLSKGADVAALAVALRGKILE
jgi:methionyl-tRNA formyltransferase